MIVWQNDQFDTQYKTKFENERKIDNVLALLKRQKCE